ncbi:MAG: hypothetical protein ABIH11_03140 [Candidatus Altiarchaeota archaeon]
MSDQEEFWGDEGQGSPVIVEGVRPKDRKTDSRTVIIVLLAAAILIAYYYLSPTQVEPEATTTTTIKIVLPSSEFIKIEKLVTTTIRPGAVRWNRYYNDADNITYLGAFEPNQTFNEKISRYIVKDNLTLGYSFEFVSIVNTSDGNEWIHIIYKKGKDDRIGVILGTREKEYYESLYTNDDVIGETEEGSSMIKGKDPYIMHYYGWWHGDTLIRISSGELTEEYKLFIEDFLTRYPPTERLKVG